MSIRFNGDVANYLSRTTSLPDYNANYTIMCWFKIAVDTNTVATIFNLATSSTLNFDRCKLDSNGTLLGVSARNPSTVVADDGTDLVVGEWRHVTMRRASVSDLRVFLEAVEDAFSNFDATGRTANDNLEIGRAHVNGLTIEPVNAEMAYLRIWSTDLTVAEIVTERVATAARKTTGLYGDYPLLNSTTAGDDISGNGNHFTVNGTITTGETQPPLVTGPSLFRGRSFLFFDDEEVNRFEFWPAVVEGATLERAASLDATASVATSAISFSVFERAGAIGASGSITITGQRVSERSASVDASAAIAVAGARVVERAATVSASATVSVAGTSFTVFEASAALAATASVESSGIAFSVFERTVSASATATIATSGLRVVQRSVSVTAVVVIISSAESFSVVERTAQLSASAGIESAATFFSIRERQVALDASATITVSRHVELMRQAAFAAAAGIVVSGGIEGGVFEHERSAAINATGLIASQATSFSVVQGSAALSATASVIVAGQVAEQHQASASLTATASIQVSGSAGAVFNPRNLFNTSRESRILGAGGESRTVVISRERRV